MKCFPRVTYYWNVSSAVITLFIVCRSWWRTRAAELTMILLTELPSRSYGHVDHEHSSPLTEACSVGGLVIPGLYRCIDCAAESRTAEPDMNPQPFTCLSETTCTRFKHSFIHIKACCSVLDPLTSAQHGRLQHMVSGVNLSFRHHQTLVSE